jgi:anti-sigma28 factor (negative regulator of flagellin synthesis)
MKVNDPNDTGISGLASTKGASPALQHRYSGRRARNDEIQLSSLSQALAALQANSPHRDARVGQLSAAVGGGGYLIDPNAVSGRLIQETLAASARQ